MSRRPGRTPYFRLERAAVEAGQAFGGVRLVAAPQAVRGLGLDAQWFPSATQLLTTDGVRLITVTVSTGRRPVAALAAGL